MYALRSSARYYINKTHPEAEKHGSQVLRDIFGPDYLTPFEEQEKELCLYKKALDDSCSNLDEICPIPVGKGESNACWNSCKKKQGS